MSTIKHSKYKNSGILFELLVRQITSDMLDGKDSKLKGLLQKYFVKTELGKEYRLYESLLKNISLTEMKANATLTTLLESSKLLNKGAIRRQKYNLINEIKENYDLNKFFNHKLPQYKIQAAFYTLLEINSTDKQISTEQIINNKVTILEHLTAAPLSKNVREDETLDEFNSLDKNTKMLTYRIIMEKFNKKYENFDPSQKQILKELITSVDNKPKLKEFYTAKVIEIKQGLKALNKSTKDDIIKIKINEVINSIPLIEKNQPINDSNLVDLLQYCDLYNELKVSNGNS
jgi:hypothetical protein